jgi:hypothetical protein
MFFEAESAMSIFFRDSVPSTHFFISHKLFLKQQLQDQFIQKWFSDVMNSSRGEFYSIFKKKIELEKYLLRLPQCYSNLQIFLIKIATFVNN